MPRQLLALPLLFLAPLTALPQKDSAPPPTKKAAAKPADPLTAPDTYAGLKFRSVGPAVCSGRVVDLAVDPRNKNLYYVAVASGGVWKTTNNGTSWAPIFDDQGAYSIGCLAIDPRSPNTVWVGTGENNSQRSVGYGDGVYKSLDAGKSWKKVGLDKSEHVGRILLDPRDPSTVYVAAQGPLWNAGGDRGLYKSTDGGKSWQRILHVSDNTGITDVVCDPRNPDVLLAAAYQRRRHVWTLINGGPESAIYRSTDAGKTWSKITAGLPTVDIGRISLSVAPSRPDTIYAQVEAADGKGGIFRSLDGGLTWERRNPFDRGAMYFAGIAVDPKNPDRIVLHNVYPQLSDDGGKTLTRLPIKSVHVDTHVLWINPDNTDHYRLGCDGGVYESVDRGANWRHVANLPVAQFYDVACDDNVPFYHVYGGTQDNNTLGGPARNRSTHGITNADWFVLKGGDGFHCRVDPRDPNVVYAEAQYGAIVRYDRRTGEEVGIRPQPARGEPPLRWNWDSPIVISPHSHTRLYFAANRIYRSEDRGDSWTPVSPDLTRQLDRDKLPVMGKLWGPDAVAKHQSTSLYGNIVALSESPKKEDLLYAGTDDGLVHVTADAGKNWRKVERFPGVPDRTYVSRLVASLHNEKVVYATFNNHKNGDFAPYVLRSDDQGESWRSIASNLPANGPVWVLAEDHVDPDLLFVGTEFGLFFSRDGGKAWTRLKGGLPTIAVRDIAVQRRMNDLVVGTFGRGIYILDDYSPLRRVTKEQLARPASLLPAREAYQYIPTRQYGLRGKAFLGEEFYAADNPPYGAVFTYYLSEKLQTQKERRQAEEKKAKEVKEYPSKGALRAEAEEEAPAVVLEVHDGTGAVVRRLHGPVTKGFHRVAWDLREPAPSLPPPPAGPDDEDLFSTPRGGVLVMPGTYRVRLLLRQEGRLRPVEEAQQEFRVVMNGPDVALADRKALYDFQQQVLALRRALTGTLEVGRQLERRLADVRRAIDETPRLGTKERGLVVELEARLRAILRELRGDTALRARNENTPASVQDRVSEIVGEQAYSLAAPTATHRRLYHEASEGLAAEQGKLRVLMDKDLKEVEKLLDAAGAPWTPGRLPEWKGK
jgi:photosystem II stability/assembly factor-like uncharacterized protein